jgi:hypothetical protein
MQPCEVGTTFVDRHRLRDAVLIYGLLEVTPGGNLIPPGSKQKINCVSRFVDGPVQVFPLALNLDVSFVHSPALAD